MSDSRNHPVNITQFLGEHVGDPAIHDFLPKLKKHLLWRLRNPGFSPCHADDLSASPADLKQVHILNNRFFEHKAFRLNYTTYDLRRAQDSLNASNHANIMCLSRDESNTHPFEYARLLRLFHIEVVHQVPGAFTTTHTFDVLFVRRYQVDRRYRAGFKRKRLHRIQFLPHENPEAFDFIDPDNVIRGAHLIPAFHFKETEEFLKGRSLARAIDEVDDWLFFYVNIFVDRDMYMRYIGGGVGHYQVPLPIEDGEVDLPPEVAEESHKRIDGSEGASEDEGSEDSEGDEEGADEEEEGEEEDVITVGAGEVIDLERLAEMVEGGYTAS